MTNTNFYFKDGKYFEVTYTKTGKVVPFVFGGSGGDAHIELTERVDKEIPTEKVIEALENWL